MTDIINNDMLEKAKQDYQAKASKIAAERIVLEKAAFALFNTDVGKHVLEYFKKFTTDNRAPVCNPFANSGMTAEQSSNMGFFRSGQNSVINEILELIDKGGKGE